MAGIDLALLSPNCPLQITGAECQTLSLSWNQWFTAGTSNGSPNQGNRGGWELSMKWNGVRPVVF